MSFTSAQSTPPAFATQAARQPLLWAALAHSTGIVAGGFLWRPALWWVVAGCAFMAAAAFFLLRRSTLAGALAMGALFFAGAMHVQTRDGSLPRDTSVLSLADGQELDIVAHVTRNGRLRQGNFGETRQVVDVQTDSVTTQRGVVLPLHAGVRLSVYSAHPSEDTDREPSFDLKSPFAGIFHYGDRIRFGGKLRAPRNFRNPGAFDYQGYLADHGISALASAKAQNVETLGGFSGNRMEAWRSRIREDVIARIHELWPVRDAALIDAMVIGEEAFLDRDIRVDFQRSGTYHVLIVSGMNVSILAFVVFWTAQRMRLGKIPATLLTVGFCFAYALLTEVGAPVWRATLMCAIYMATRLLYRERAMVNAVGGAALAVLVFDPRQLFTASFQMTFLCVLIVAAIGLPMLDRTTQLYKRALVHWDSADYARKLPAAVAQFRVDLRFIAGRLALFMGEKWAGRLVRLCVKGVFVTFELLFISAVMQMGLALPMAFYFHRATTVGLPANIAAVPLTELMMPSAISAIALSFVSRPLATVPGYMTSITLRGITGTVHGLGGLRLADLRVPNPSLLMIASGAAALVLAMVVARSRMIVSVTGLAAMCATAVAIAAVPPKANFHPGVLEVTSIDVGQGDSTLLVMPQGKTLLIDAGGPIGPGSSEFDFGEDVVSPYLWARGISRLDAVAITHAHSDHIGGMAAVMKNFRPHELWLGVRPPSEALDRLLAQADMLHINVVRHWEGDEFDWGGATVGVLFPPRDWLPGAKPQNSDSMVLQVNYGSSSVLLEGDAEKQVERRIATLHHPKADLLRVGHHGSANATTPELLDSAKPEFAVISAGYRNSFGLPKFETLQRLSLQGARVYRTDVDGAVTFYLDGRVLTPSLAALR